MKTKKYAPYFFLLLIALGSALLLSDSWQKRSQSPDLMEKRLRNTLQTYLGSLPVQPESWWMLKIPPPSPTLADSLEQATKNIEQAVKRARDISPLTKEISEHFSGGFFASVFDHGQSRVTMKDADPKALEGKTEVCFFSKEESKELFSLLFYRNDWKAVMLAGIRWEEPFFSALLMHELGHGLRASQGEKATVNSDEWCEREIEMHELEALVLDRLTAGRYFFEINAIIRAHKAERTDEFLAKLTVEDLLALDRSIGVEQSGTDIRGTSCAEHLIALGCRFIDTHDRKASKIGLYRFAVSCSY